jgi:hypothetical protein
VDGYNGSDSLEALQGFRKPLCHNFKVCHGFIHSGPPILDITTSYYPFGLITSLTPLPSPESMIA